MTKDEFVKHIRELCRPDIGDEADTLTEEEFICDLAEDGWPDYDKWLEIWNRLYTTGGELTVREREQALAYWDSGEDYPSEEFRL